MTPTPETPPLRSTGEGLAAELLVPLEMRGDGAVVREAENEDCGPAKRRLAAANEEIGRWLGNNWPAILTALEATGPSVEAAVAEAVERERERCAKLCEELPSPWDSDDMLYHAHCVEAGSWSNAADACATAIQGPDQ